MLRVFFHITREAKKKVLAILRRVLTGGRNEGTMYEVWDVAGAALDENHS